MYLLYIMGIMALSYILHGVGRVEEKTKTRYCLVSNLIEQADWKTKKVIKDISDAR